MRQKQQEGPIEAKIEGEPNSLVMFADIDEVIQNMFTKLIYQVIWIRNYPQAQKVAFMSNDLEVKIKCLADPFSAIQFLQDCSSLDKNSSNRYIVICSYYLTNQQYQTLKKYAHLQLINYTPIHQLQQNPVDTNPQDIDFNIYVETQDQLIQKLKLLTAQKVQPKQFSNFHFLPLENYIIHNYVRIVSTMIKIPINLALRKKIVDQLEKLVCRLSELDEEYRFFKVDMKQFLEELREGKLSDARAIFWYTSELPLYKLLNNLFRSYDNPSHIFYIQPFFKDLFRTIQHQSNKSISQLSQRGKLTCYRGGTITTQQYMKITQNISYIIQTSSFLSTSRQQKIAVDYEKNFKVQIQIQSTYIHLYEELFKNGIGFTFLGNNSYYSNQCQVLFSPLNLFKILQAKNIQVGELNYFYVKLKHYCPQQCKSEDNFHSNQKFFCHILTQSIRLYYGQFFINFGANLLPSEAPMLPEIQYVFWTKFYQIANNCYNKKIGALNLARINQHYNNYKQALNLLYAGYKVKLSDFPQCIVQNENIKSEQFEQAKIQDNQIQYYQLQLLHIITSILIRLKRYDEVILQIRVRKQQLNKMNNKGYFKQNVYHEIKFKIYFDEAIARKCMGEYKRAIDVLVECKGIIWRCNSQRIVQYHHQIIQEIGHNQYYAGNLQNAMFYYQSAKNHAQLYHGSESLKIFHIQLLITMIYTTKCQFNAALQYTKDMENRFKRSKFYPDLQHKLTYIISKLHFDLFEYEESYALLNNNRHIFINSFNICHSLQLYVRMLMIIAHIECFVKGNVVRSRSLLQKCISIYARANRRQIKRYWACVLQLKHINDDYGYDKHSYNLLQKSIDENWKFCPAPKKRQRLKQVMGDLQRKMRQRKCKKRKVFSFIDY